MTADKLFDHLEATGFQLTVIEGGRLKVEPKDKITDEIRQGIRKHKQELVRLLSGGPVRTWTPGNPFLCSCGFPTGWKLNGEVLCPRCFYRRQNGSDSADNTGAPKEQPEPCNPNRSTAPCQDCNRFEIISIAGRSVAGCLYPITEGPWSEGWKRLPDNLEACLWN
jgi:hypothetical protein